MLLGNDFNANSRRLGIITFRIAMVLSVLRLIKEKELPKTLTCSDTDFNTALSIAITCEKHAMAVFHNMPNHNLKGTKLRFFEALPNEFNRKKYLAVARKLEIKDKTAESYIGQFVNVELLAHEHNKYSKILPTQDRTTETQDS